MSFPLRIKFLLVAGAVSVISLGSSMWILSTQLEQRIVAQIGARLTNAQVTLDRWRIEHEVHLSSEARIVAHDPRFFAAVAEGDEATATPSAREFQRLANSDLLLVADRRGRRLVHLDETGESRSLDWPREMPPSRELLQWGEKLYLLQAQAVAVATDTVAYVALGERVDSGLAAVMSRIADADILFFSDRLVYGSTIPLARSTELISHLAASRRNPGDDSPSLAVVQNERLLYRLGGLARDGNVQYAVVTSLDAHLMPQLISMRQAMLVVGTIALVLAMAISWAVAHRITARVPELVKAVEAVARGEYEAVVAHRGTDELSVVAAAVDRMRRELATQIEAIRRANTEKLASERLAVIGKMASTIIHDFKTPMQVIRSASELLSDEELPASRRPKYTQMIMSELDRMVGMAHDLLGFARGERRMARSIVRIDTFLHEAITAWRQICSPRGIAVEFIDTARVSVAIDSEKILRALDNITMNAVEVLSRGGVITVHATCDEQKVYVQIADTGPGIPAEVKDKIFEPFSTFGKEHGTGLGLAMAKKAIEDHGGSITVASAPGAGASFTVTLPLSPRGVSPSTSQTIVAEEEVVHEMVS